MAPRIDENVGVEGIPYFTPKHPVTPGTAIPGKNENVPTLFKPLTIRNATLRNRIMVAPMYVSCLPPTICYTTMKTITNQPPNRCQYSTAAFGPETGALTDYHVATLGQYALKGASLVFIEATGVQANGRISPNCPGLWTDAQIPALRRVSDFMKSQGALSGIQLAHAGRKASTAPSWCSMGAPGKRISIRSSEAAGGWPENVVGPMGGDDATWDGVKGSEEKGGFYAPKALSEAQIGELVQDWARAAERAVKAGIDVIEIHAAHGYLLNQFLSPVTNQRTDKYGGSFENRTRVLVEIIQAMRKVIPESMPLFLRISATEWLEDTEVGKKYGSWDVESSIKLAKMLPGLGIDLLDVSSGGNHPSQKINTFASKDYQTRIASRIRTELQKDGLKLLIGAVGLITEAEQAKGIVEEGGAAKKAADTADIEAEAKAAVHMTEPADKKEALADVVLVARQFMREPEWVLKVASQLGVEVAWPIQALHIRFPKL
jgi:2,4-dienoyl-CoA reductase-like NADH-dependent reductase (Old Yellow Enzyme family)